MHQHLRHQFIRTIKMITLYADDILLIITKSSSCLLSVTNHIRNYNRCSNYSQSYFKCATNLLHCLKSTFYQTEIK